MGKKERMENAMVDVCYIIICDVLCLFIIGVGMCGLALVLALT